MRAPMMPLGTALWDANTAAMNLRDHPDATEQQRDQAERVCELIADALEIVDEETV